MPARSSQPLHADTVQPLSLRARVLLGLERMFPVVDAPHGEGRIAEYEFRKAAGSYAKAVDEIGGVAGKTVLDFGCGWGGETAWLAQRARFVVGCDISASSLAEARRFQERQSIANIEFVQCMGDRLPLEDARFDAVFSTNVFEHVMNVPAMLGEIRRVLRPGGAFVTTFGPLFYSPRGYHLCWATQVPYAHLLFGLGPVMEVRNLKREPMQARTWQDTGLNMMTFAQFRAAVRGAGFEVRRLRRVPVRKAGWIAQLPIVGELFTFGIDCHLVKPR